jgi:hypothetical protein
VYVELLAHWESGSLAEAQKKDLRQRIQTLQWAVYSGTHLDRWRFWNWLSEMVWGRQDRQTVSVF